MEKPTDKIINAQQVIISCQKKLLEITEQANLEYETKMNNLKKTLDDGLNNMPTLDDFKMQYRTEQFNKHTELYVQILQFIKNGGQLVDILIDNHDYLPNVREFTQEYPELEKQITLREQELTKQLYREMLPQLTNATIADTIVCLDKEFNLEKLKELLQ